MLLHFNLEKRSIKSFPNNTEFSVVRTHNWKLFKTFAFPEVDIPVNVPPRSELREIQKKKKQKHVGVTVKRGGGMVMFSVLYLHV